MSLIVSKTRRHCQMNILIEKRTGKLDFLHSLYYIRFMPVLRSLPVKVSEEEILRFQSSSHKSQLLDKIREAAKEARRLAHPLAIYKIKQVRQVTSNLICLEDGTEFHGNDLASRWQGATLLGIGLCTIGPWLENRVSQLYSGGNLLAATLLDSAGSVAVEGVANSLNFHLCRWATRRGMNLGPRLSPGYGKWNILEQKLLFKILSGERIDICLNEQCMMTPTKSISFCVGIGSNIKLTSVEPCRYCSMDNCEYRRRNVR